MSLDLIQLFSSFFLLMNEWKHFENFYLTVNLHLKPDAVCWSLSFMSFFFPVVTLFKLFSDFYFTSLCRPSTLKDTVISLLVPQNRLASLNVTPQLLLAVTHFSCFCGQLLLKRLSRSSTNGKVSSSVPTYLVCTLMYPWERYSSWNCPHCFCVSMLL